MRYPVVAAVQAGDAHPAAAAAARCIATDRGTQHLQRTEHPQYRDAGTLVGLIARDCAVTDRRCAAEKPQGYAAAMVRGRIAADRAVADRDRLQCFQGRHAATEARRIVHDARVAEAERAGRAVQANAAAGVAGRAAADLDPLQRNRRIADHHAATESLVELGTIGQTVSEAQIRNADAGHTEAADIQDLRAVVAGQGQTAGPRSAQTEPAENIDPTTGQYDAAGHRTVEQHGIVAGGQIGIENGLAQAAGAGVIVVAHGKGGSKQGGAVENREDGSAQDQATAAPLGR